MLTGANVEADEEALKEFLASDVLPPPGVWTAVRSKYMELANTVAEQSESIRALKKQNAGRGSVARDESSQRSSRCVRRQQRFVACPLLTTCHVCPPVVEPEALVRSSRHVQPGSAATSVQAVAAPRRWSFQT